MESPVIIVIALLAITGILIYWKIYQFNIPKSISSSPISADVDDECYLGNCEEAMCLWGDRDYSSQGSFMIGSPFKAPQLSEDSGSQSSNLAPVLNSQ